MCLHREGNKQNCTLLVNDSNNLCKPPTYDLKSSLWTCIHYIGTFYYLVLSLITVNFRPRELQICLNEIVPELESLARRVLVLP
jgi:hypothetical protein